MKLRLTPLFDRLGAPRFIGIHGEPWPQNNVFGFLATPDAGVSVGITLAATFLAAATAPDLAGLTLGNGLLNTGIGCGIVAIFTEACASRLAPFSGRKVTDCSIDRQGRAQEPADAKDLEYQTKRLRLYARWATGVFAAIGAIEAVPHIMRLSHAVMNGYAPNPLSVTNFCLMGTATLRWALLWRRCNKLISKEYVFADTSVGKFARAGGKATKPSSARPS